MLQFPESHNPKPGRPESCQGPGDTGFLGRAVSPEASVTDLFPFGYRASSRDAALTFGWHLMPWWRAAMWAQLCSVNKPRALRMAGSLLQSLRCYHSNACRHTGISRCLKRRQDCSYPVTGEGCREQLILGVGPFHCPLISSGWDISFSVLGWGQRHSASGRKDSISWDMVQHALLIYHPSKQPSQESSWQHNGWLQRRDLMGPNES